MIQTDIDTMKNTNSILTPLVCLPNDSPLAFAGVLRHRREAPDPVGVKGEGY